MDYLRKIDLVINYIENNIKEEMSIEELAQMANLSKFYFHRIFSSTAKISLMEYIKMRRISNAAQELVNSNKSIIEIAFDYQFNSHEAFSRAFKNIYGISPREYRNNKLITNIYEKLDVIKLRDKDVILLEPKIIFNDEFKIIGLSCTTTSTENNEKAIIPALWDKFIPRIGEIKNFVSSTRTLGLCEIIENSDDSFTYVCCKEVKNFDFIPEGMIAKVVPSSRYAVFTHKGNVENLGETYDYIYGSWLPKSGYEINGVKHDFELYDERFDNSPSSEMEIYIPIK